MSTSAPVSGGPPITSSPRRARPRNRNRGANNRTGQVARAGEDVRQGDHGGQPGLLEQDGPGINAVRGSSGLPRAIDLSSENSPGEDKRSPRGARRGRGGAAGRGGLSRSSNNTSGQSESQPQNRLVQTSRNAPGRQFGGQLSSTASETTPLNSHLNAEAAEYHPDNTPRTPNGTAQPRRKRRYSRSTAPDIATRIHEDIDHGLYECAICTNEVLRNSRVWSCRTCWTVFHLSCIKKWASKQGSAAAQQLQGETEPPPRQWRCPGCNLPKDSLPSTFTCWCEKELDPKAPVGLPPFCCGQTCSKSRVLPKKCPHPCYELCHAGPCPPCGHTGPSQRCFCQRESSTKRCVETDYESGWSCGSPCGELMHCGIHTCSRPCHEGPCGACEVRLDARCYCGKKEKSILCRDNGEEKASELLTVSEGEARPERWTGRFECNSICGRFFDCGVHRCENSCHPQNLEAAHCPRSPELVTYCPCGKTLLSELRKEPRRSCEDAIPNCQKLCDKLLACGHACKQECHSGECRPCLKTVSIVCNCGRTTSSSLCHQGSSQAPQCMRVCRTTLNCGRHECSERCCSGERRATERQANKRKPRPLGSAPAVLDSNFEAEHICTRQCGRPLKCGSHTCHELCHKGPCGSCPEAIFDEVSCNCGKTVLQPPLPCGTKPPPCRFPCERTKICGHPQVSHTCHPDEESCPKCPFLTAKSCLCGKNVLKNQPCWLAEARCGEVCGRKLRCGAHRCKMTCHRPGGCEDMEGPCRQACGKEKRCGHPCSQPCHSPFPCKEDRPCESKILVTCDCQRVKQEARCGASRAGDGNLKKTLRCDDECARLERNRKLALALSIDPAAHSDDHVPYAAETLRLFAEGASSWAPPHERDFRAFAADSDARRLRFRPAPAHQRTFLHALAADFGLDSESMDPEPHRHVAVFKTPRFVAAPMKTLAECVRIRSAQRAGHDSSSSAAAVPRARLPPPLREPFNALLLSGARFGLTAEELRTALKPALDTAWHLRFDTTFLPGDEVLIAPPPSTATAATTDDSTSLDKHLHALRPHVSRLVRAHTLGSSLQLARADEARQAILQRESDDPSPFPASSSAASSAAASGSTAAAAAGGGWSQVAAKAPPARAPRTQPVGGGGAFAVLSLGSARRRKEKEKKERDREAGGGVADDWEAEEEREEEREKRLSGMAVEEGERSAGEGSGPEDGQEGGGVAIGNGSGAE